MYLIIYIHYITLHCVEQFFPYLGCIYIVHQLTLIK